MFYLLYPESKSEFKPYLDLISGIRNNSVHALINFEEKFVIERILYIALRILDFLGTKNLFSEANLLIIDKTFLSEYDFKRYERVKKEFQKVKENLAHVPVIPPTLDIFSWDKYIIKCPVCHSDSLLDGYSESESEKDEDDDTYTLWLWFILEKFKCDQCGLELMDSKELQLSWLETGYDRCTDVDQWIMDEEAER